MAQDSKIQSRSKSSRRARMYFTIFTLVVCIIGTFENCSNVKFQTSSASLSAQGATNPADHTYFTSEDTPLTATPSSIDTIVGQSTYIQLTTPNSGQLVRFNQQTTEFTYQPGSHYFGSDQFQYSEMRKDWDRPVIHTIKIVVRRTGLPNVDTDFISVNVNVVSPFKINVSDLEVPNPFSGLSADNLTTSVQTPKGGAVVKSGTGYTYTPATGFRGIDEVTIFAIDSAGGFSSKVVNINVGNPFQTIQPAMAARGVTCILCHGNFASNLITDMGAGDHFFLNHDQNPYNNLSMYGWGGQINATTHIPYWVQGNSASQFTNGASIVVPNVNLGFRFADYAPSTADKSMPWLAATSMKDLFTALSAYLSVPAPIIAKNKLYIGTPTISDIKKAGALDGSHSLQYYPNSKDSYALSGFALTGSYYSNTSLMLCDGDLFVDGTVFLNSLQLQTINGCRIHATGPIFVQKSISYMGDAKIASLPNLQLASARLISMGVGLTNCESSTNPGWYSGSLAGGDTKHQNPLKFRLQSFTDATDWADDIFTRNADPLITGYEKVATSNFEEAKALVALAGQVHGLEDSSCHGRNVHFEKLFLLAPQIDSRYQGNFSGVVITEIPLFALSDFSFTFDPVFQKVPVLPLLDPSKYLIIEN